MASLKHGTHLVTVAGIHVEPMGIYGGKQDSLAPIQRLKEQFL